jgi:hypothetical protein
MVKKKKSTRGSLVRYYAEGVGATVLESPQESVKRVIGRKSGVYILTKNGQPYYVGLASKIRSRLGRHLKDKHKGKWDRFSIYLIGRQKFLKDIESILIRVLSPKGNGQSGRFAKKGNLVGKLKAEILQDVKKTLGI